MVRLFKILSAFLDQTAQKRRETGEILARLAFETIVNVRFLVKNFHPATIDSYVRRALRHERQLRDKILSNIENRRGDVLPIERRMLNSIDRTARIAGISLETIDPGDKTHWAGQSIYQKAKEIGLGEAYMAMFGGLSHNVHGSWFDIYQHHVTVDETDDGKFSPSLEWDLPRPQILIALGHLTVEAILDVVGFLGGREALDQLRDQLSDLDDRLGQASHAHEEYLCAKPWPQI